jgi:inner membrane protein involved in colicin E2 resistance
MTLIVMGAVSNKNLHPMHYFFLGASFFSFHILFAYLVDHLLLEVAFIIAAIVSMVLVGTYLYRAAGVRFALWASIAQFVFLVLFSYAFFFEGYTGLVITIGAITTLAIMMQLTAKVDWVEVFRKKEPRSQPGD